MKTPINPIDLVPNGPELEISCPPSCLCNGRLIYCPSTDGLSFELCLSQRSSQQMLQPGIRGNLWAKESPPETTDPPSPPPTGIPSKMSPTLVEKHPSLLSSLENPKQGLSHSKLLGCPSTKPTPLWHEGKVELRILKFESIWKPCFSCFVSGGSGRGPGKTAWIVEVRWPSNMGNSLTNTRGESIKFWYSFLTFLILSGSLFEWENVRGIDKLMWSTQEIQVISMNSFQNPRIVAYYSPVWKAMFHTRGRRLTTNGFRCNIIPGSKWKDLSSGWLLGFDAGSLWYSLLCPWMSHDWHHPSRSLIFWKGWCGLEKTAEFLLFLIWS